MQATWVLVADAARARLFEAETGTLNELGCYVDADSRGGARGLATGRPPTVNESMGSARHSIEPHTSPREKAAARFARSLREVLEQGQHAQRFARLVLVAPPRFLGALHAAFGRPLRDCVIAEIRRDFTQLAPENIHARLPRRVFH